MVYAANACLNCWDTGHLFAEGRYYSGAMEHFRVQGIIYSDWTGAVQSGDAAPNQTPCSQTARRVSLRHRSEEHTSELQSRENLVCRLLLEKKKYSHVDKT